MPRQDESIRKVLAAATLAALLSRTLEAQPPRRWLPSRCATDTTQVDAQARAVTVDTVAPGVTYRCERRPDGPWVLHIVSVDLRNGRWALDGVRAHDRFTGREPVSHMAERLAAAGAPPVVAVNADFFDLGTGEVENNHVIAGAWVKGVRLTDSPHDEFDNAHTQFAGDREGALRMGRFSFRGAASSGARSLELIGINHRPPHDDGLVLYTPWYGSRTLRDTSDRMAVPRPADPDNAPRRAGETRPVAPPSSGPPAPAPPSAAAPAPSVAALRADSTRRAVLANSRRAVEVALVAAGRRGDTLLYRVRPSSVRRGGGMRIPPRGAVLSATGDSAEQFVRAVARRGGLVHVLARLGDPDFAPTFSVGGWPRVVQDGRNVALAADSLEGTFPRFSRQRHPRSAIALSADRATLYLVVVDGRRAWSVGMTLAELGDALLSLGAAEGMNLDGGGSSALWVRGVVVNSPSDPTGERAVGNALVVRPRRR